MEKTRRNDPCGLGAASKKCRPHNDCIFMEFKAFWLFSQWMELLRNVCSVHVALVENRWWDTQIDDICFIIVVCVLRILPLHSSIHVHGSLFLTAANNVCTISCK
jgi:hypothetical protein